MNNTRSSAPRILLAAMFLALLALLPTATTYAQGPTYGGSYYVVRYGDTMTSIAARFGVSLQTLERANGMTSGYNNVYVGRQLYMPGRTGQYGMPSYGQNYGAGRAVYTVRFGDTLTRIALRFGTSVYALAIANNIPNPNLIFAGMRLVIPSASSYASRAPMYGPQAPYGSQSPSSSPYGSRPPSYAPPAMAPSATPMPSMGTPVPAPAARQAVSIKNMAFNPGSVTVHVGTTVVWTNEESSAVPHTVTSGTPSAPSAMFDSGTLNPGQSFQFTFNTAGTFAYFCRIHGAAMTGTVVVTP